MGFAVMTGKWIPPRKPKGFYKINFGLFLVDEMAGNLKCAKAFHRWLGRVIDWAEYKRRNDK